MKQILAQILGNLDITEIFKTKGNLRRWSAKRSVGGIIVLTACNDVLIHGISWQGVVMCLVGVLPLILSLYEYN